MHGTLPVTTFHFKSWFSGNLASLRHLLCMVPPGQGQLTSVLDILLCISLVIVLGFSLLLILLRQFVC